MILTRAYFTTTNLRYKKKITYSKNAFFFFIFFFIFNGFEMQLAFFFLFYFQILNPSYFLLFYIIFSIWYCVVKYIRWLCHYFNRFPFLDFFLLLLIYSFPFYFVFVWTNEWMDGWTFVLFSFLFNK